MTTQSNGNGKTEQRRQEVQQAVKNACDQLNSDGVTPRDYVEQLAWLFFLKAFDEAETRHEQEASFDDSAYTRRIEGDHRWSAWSSWTNNPDAMLEFVDGKLWHYLENFGSTPDTEQFANDPIAERFRRIFSTVRNHSRRGASFARVIQQVNRLHFSDETDVIVLSELYEDLLKRVASDSAGYAGEFYTQRHIIRAMVAVVKPKIGDRVYDPCFGTAGFLAESAEYIRANSGSLSGKDLDALNRKTFFGVELKPLTYLLGIMNMILHRIEGANLEQANSLELHAANVPEKNKYDVILANPPYGGKLARELQTNFTVHSGATEILFLQHIMANLKKGGRAAVIVPEGVLYRGGPDAKVRRRLVTEFNLHTVLSLPAGCFLPYTSVKTNVLFFELPDDGRVTADVWFYELSNDGFELRQTRKPIVGTEIPDFIDKYGSRVSTTNSWLVPVDQVVKNGYDLSARNPKPEASRDLRPALQLIEALKTKEERVLSLLSEVEELPDGPTGDPGPTWTRTTVGALCDLATGTTPPSKQSEYFGGDIQWYTPSDVVDAMYLTASARTLTALAIKEKKARLFPAGTILMTAIGNIGRVGILETTASANQQITGLSLTSDRVDKEYLFYWLVANRAEIERRASQATLPIINQAKIRKIPVLHPPLDQQRQIVERIKDCISRMDEIDTLRSAADDELVLLRAAVLRRSLVGIGAPTAGSRDALPDTERGRYNRHMEPSLHPDGRVQ